MICVYAHVGSSLETVDRQTQLRCDQAIIAHRQHPYLPILIATAAKKNREWVGESMKNYLVERGIPVGQIFFKPGGHTTVDETDAFLSLVCQHSSQSASRIIVVSTWYHLPRICWLWLARKRLVKMAIAWKGSSLSDLILEPAKLLINLLLPFYVPPLLHR